MHNRVPQNSRKEFCGDRQRIVQQYQRADSLLAIQPQSQSDLHLLDSAAKRPMVLDRAESIPSRHYSKSCMGSRAATVPARPSERKVSRSSPAERVGRDNASL